MLRSRRTLFALALLFLFSAAPAAYSQGFTFGNFVVLSSNRVSRTEWDFVIQVTVTNQVASATGLSAFVFSSSPNTTPLQNFLTIGDIPFGSSMASTGTVVIRQDRVFPFDPSALRWTVYAETMPLSVNIDSPVGGILTNGSNIVVTGSVGAAVDAVLVGRFPATLVGSNFTATVPLEEGRNTITALATNSFRGAGVANVVVTRDSTPPVINIEAPADGALLSTRQVTVTGMVNDAVPGTVNPEQATVMVNGLPAAILNRSYSIPDVLLVPGKNKITVKSRDKAGNESQREIEVTYRNPASQKHLVRLAGDGQTGVIGSILPQPLVVELVDGDGVVQTNQPVTFTVTRNDGAIAAPPDSGRTLTLLTDYRGQAQVIFELGTRTGAGNNQVAASSAGVADSVLFCANAIGAPPTKISALIPETQVGEAGKPLPLPWTAFVTDAGGNPVPNIPVVFMVFQGDGRIGGATMLNTNTDTDGRASAVLTLGPDEGVNNNVVLAMVPGLTNSSATFTASGQIPRQVSETRISGLVLDHANRPMSNIACRVIGTLKFSFTDAQGQFVISNAPVGAVRLFVDARNRGYTGEWHYLEFNMVTIAGRDNRLERPVYMLELDTANQVLAGGNQDVTLHLKGIPGSTLTIFAHSVRDADGHSVVTNVTWTQVNAERVPMTPPLGSQPTLTSAVQPANLRFNPPARMCIPNNGGVPGQVLELYSFDHDIGSFVSVGTATVSADGSQICSDPGFGIVKSGWHPFVPPPPPCSPVCSPKPPDTACATYDTIPPTSKCGCPTYKKVNKADDTPCTDDGKDCTEDKCMGGVCTHPAKPPTGGACANAPIATAFPEHLNGGHQVVPGNAFASTVPHYSDTKVETTACLDGNTFKMSVTSATSPVDIDEHATLQGRQDCDTVVLTAANYCKVVDDLDDQDYSHIPCISRACNLAHERAHKKEWEDNWNARFPALKTAIEALSVAADSEICTPEKAKAKLKAQVDNLINAAVAAGRTQWNGEGEGVNGEAAEDACNAGKILGICATGKAMGFPACALCPP